MPARDRRNPQARRPTVAIGHCGALITGVEVDVREHPPWIVTGQLYVDLLPRVVAMEEETCHKTGTSSRADLGFEPSMREGPGACKRPRAIGPASIIRDTKYELPIVSP